MRRVSAVTVPAVVTVALVAVVAAVLLREEPRDPAREITIPAGATFREVVDTLANRAIVTRPGPFSLYARLKGADRRVRAGRYSFRGAERWSRIVEDLTAGHVLTEALTVPEGFTLDGMSPRIAVITGLPEEEVRERLRADSLAGIHGVPGPGLEGYLFPDTYLFAPGTPLERVVDAMVERYRSYWTPERRADLQASGLDERELVTLASIIQAEARRTEEMPRISSVYHNRLRLGYLLQADPTVLYALGGHRDRLLYAAIDSVADHPYNTYARPGLPPGPIGAPGAAALDAALRPADTDFLYFVARPNGEHVFTRTLAEHNRAKAAARREWDTARTATGTRPPGEGSGDAQGAGGSGGGGGPSP